MGALQTDERHSLRSRLLAWSCVPWLQLRFDFMIGLQFDRATQNKMYKNSD